MDTATAPQPRPTDYVECLFEPPTTSSAATTGSNVNSTTDAAIARAPRLYDRYPRWDGDFDSFENWLLAVDLPLSDPEMAPRLGSAAHCTQAGHLAPTGAARIEIHKSGLNEFIRTAAATRGFKSDVDWDEYSNGLRALATELEQLPSFVNAKGSKVSLYVNRRGAPLPMAYGAKPPVPSTPVPRVDPDGDTVMGGVNAISTTTDFAAQIAAMESQLSSRIAAIQSNAPGQRNNGGGSPAGW
ncbi:hypothetical protein E4U61_007420 [Claviceps capensis]|nr:hypothetical protein E4U61_007420 [Claviceps capensis]